VDLKQIEYFLRVAELRSFSRAAEYLNISQSALSRQVRLLELDLRQHLLYRNGRGVEPTEAGERFVGYAKALLQLVDRAREDMQSMQDAPSGKVTLGLPPRVAHVLTPPMVLAFRKQFPQGAISVAEGLSAQTREWLITGRVDIALLYDPPPSPLLGYETLFREELVLVCARTQTPALPASVTVAELANYPLILPSQPNAIRTLTERVCGSQNVRLNVVAEVDAVHTITELAAQGHAYAILPESAVVLEANPDAFATARITSPAIRNNLVLAVPRSRPMTRLAVATAALIRGTDFPSLFVRTARAAHADKPGATETAMADVEQGAGG
jgi:LysR family nitrogen assimilation transcriptional regulator